MRDSHGGATPSPFVATTGDAGADVHAGGAYFWLKLLPEGGASATEGGNGVLEVGGAHGERFRIASRRGNGTVAQFPTVPSTKSRKDTRRPQGLYVGQESKIGHVGKARPPRVVNHVGGFARIRIAAVKIRGSQQPLEARVDPGVIADTVVIQNLDRYPLSVGSHADVEIFIRSRADYDAHGMGAMTVPVSRGAGISARAIIPVVVVVSV